MATTLYCWRCEREVPLLDEEEYARVKELLWKDTRTIKDYRGEHGASLQQALREAPYGESLREYERITGFRETNMEVLWHHRLSKYGPPCERCGRPRRTPAATRCVDCPPTQPL